MPYLSLKKLNKQEKANKNLKPIAIVKSEIGDKHKLHNHLILYHCGGRNPYIDVGWVIIDFDCIIYNFTMLH